MGATPGSYLVECYWPDITEAEFAAATRRIAAATATARSEGTDVVYLGAFLMPVDEAVFCMFHGTEAGVRTVSAQAQLPFERVVASRWLDPHADQVTGGSRSRRPRPPGLSASGRTGGRRTR